MSKGSRKRDTGIARLNNGYLISEETRDALQKHHWQGPRTQIDLNHPDNWTTKECMDKRFTGIRFNKLRNFVEIWVMGNLEEDCHASVCTEGKLASMHERVFATGGTLLEVNMPRKS